MPVTTDNIHHGQGRQVDMANSDAKPCNPDGSVVDNLLPGDACGVGAWSSTPLPKRKNMPPPMGTVDSNHDRSKGAEVWCLLTANLTFRELINSPGKHKPIDFTTIPLTLPSRT